MMRGAYNGGVKTFREIAEQLNMPLSTVHRIYRGVFARMDASGIPRQRGQRRRRADELAAA